MDGATAGRPSTARAVWDQNSNALTGSACTDQPGQGVLNDYSIDLWKQQLASITEAHGLASFLVHPDYLIERRARRTYQALLEHLALMREERKMWMTLPREVNRWWRERSQMTVVCDGGRWRIEGQGKERPRLAFATLTGRELTFTTKSRPDPFSRPSERSSRTNAEPSITEYPRQASDDDPSLHA